MNYDFLSNNKVFLTGEIVSKPVYSHEIYGEGFYELMLSVQRLSDYCDIIPITISERLMLDEKFELGRTISIKGQFRSYNKVIDDKSRLMLTVFVRELVEDCDEQNPNILEAVGNIELIEYVLSTATHFVLKKYKDHGTILAKQHEDYREVITPWEIHYQKI